MKFKNFTFLILSYIDLKLKKLKLFPWETDRLSSGFPTSLSPQEVFDSFPGPVQSDTLVHARHRDDVSVLPRR